MSFYTGLIDRHARSIIMVAVALALAGAVAALTLPVGLFPQIAFPRVVVDLDAGDRPAAETALLITRPVELAIRAVPGVREIRSSSSRGSAQISIDFGWGRDMIAETLAVDSAIGEMLANLPPGTHYDVRRMDPTVFPIISYGLTSENVTPTDLRDLADLQLVPMLSAIDGLAHVGVQGGDMAEFQVLTDPQRLAPYGLAMSDLVSAVATANVLQAVGRVQDQGKLYLVVADNSLHAADELRNIVVKSDAGGIVRLSDVADVQNGVVPQWIRVSQDGKPAVLLNVYEQPDGNAVAVAKAVKAKLDGFALPPGVHLNCWYDQSELVLQSAASVRDAVLIGLVLAAFVLVWFLRSWRITLIAVAVVPMTLAATILVLSIAGMSFNLMTLGGIAASVGLLIDDVIVMIEHIARRSGAAPEHAGTEREAGAANVLSAAREFLRPLTGSSLATLIVFLPLTFLSGVTGAFSKALALTMASALTLSYLMAAFVVPLLTRWFVDFGRWHDPGHGRETRFSRAHAGLLDCLLRRPWWLALSLVPLLVIGGIAYTRVPTGFMPAVDEGGFVLDFYTRPGTSLIETDRELRQVEAIVKAQPEVLTFSRRTGTGLGGDLGEPNHGDFFVRLKPDHARATPDIMAAVMKETEEKVPGVEIELAQLTEDLIGDLTAVPQPIEIKLYGAETPRLIAEATKVASAIAKIDGVVEVKSGVVFAGDGLNLIVDPARAAMEGVSADDVAKAVSLSLGGGIATNLPLATKAVGVRVRQADAASLRQRDLGTLAIRAADGHLVLLKRVASLVPVTGEAEVSRDNLQPMIAVTARVEGRGIGAAIGDVRGVLDRPGYLAAGLRYELGGLYQQQQIAFVGLAKVFTAALIAELILLLFLYERLWMPIVIVLSSLLSTTGVFIALWLSGVELNITALMGMTMIIGIGAEMAIFYVSEYVALCQTLPPREALSQASRNRLRPITMTTLAAILTLLPLAFAIGQGSGIQQPLAIAIIAGLTIQYPMVLLGLPIAIALVSGKKRIL